MAGSLLCDVLCYLTMLIAAAYSLLPFTLLPDSLNWVDKPKIILIREKRKEKEEKDAIILVYT